MFKKLIASVTHEHALMVCLGLACGLFMLIYHGPLTSTLYPWIGLIWALCLFMYASILYMSCTEIRPLYFIASGIAAGALLLVSVMVLMA